MSGDIEGCTSPTVQLGELGTGSILPHERQEADRVPGPDLRGPGVDDREVCGVRECPEHVRALAAGRAHPVGVDRHAGELDLALDRGPALRCDAFGGRHLGIETGQGPQHRQHEHVERHERAHRVAGQRDDRRAALADDPGALRHPGTHRDLDEVDRPRARQHLLDRVVGPHRHPARGEDEVGPPRDVAKGRGHGLGVKDVSRVMEK